MTYDLPVTVKYGDKSQYDYEHHVPLSIHIVYVVVYVHIDQL